MKFVPFLLSLALLSSCEMMNNETSGKTENFEVAIEEVPENSTEQDIVVVKPYTDIKVSELSELTKDGKWTLVDVRTPGEIADGKIDNALEIDWKNDNFKERVSKLDPDGNYIIYCRSGGRSVDASLAMSDLGFKNLKNLLGGFNDYVKQ
jgi:phage shock protein E